MLSYLQVKITITFKCYNTIAYKEKERLEREREEERNTWRKMINYEK